MHNNVHRICVTSKLGGRRFGPFVFARKQDHLCLRLHTVIHVYSLQNSMVTNSNTKKLISTCLLEENQISQQSKTPKYLCRTKSWHPKTKWINYHSTLVAWAQIILFSEMLKFSNFIFLEEENFVKENEETFEIFW